MTDHISIVVAWSGSGPDTELRIVAAYRDPQQAAQMANDCNRWVREGMLNFPGEDEQGGPPSDDAMDRYLAQKCPHDAGWTVEDGYSAWVAQTIELR